MKPAWLAAPVAFALALAPGLSRAELKLAYVDFQRALVEVKEGQQAKARLKKQFDDKQKTLDKAQEELRRDKEALDKQAMAMSEDKLREKQMELNQKLAELSQLWQKMQKELSEEEQRITKEIGGKMESIVREIAQAESIDMVFEKNDAGLVYAPASLDLTNELVRRYNARFSGGAKPGASKDEKSSSAAPSKSGK